MELASDCYHLEILLRENFCYIHSILKPCFQTFVNLLHKSLKGRKVFAAGCCTIYFGLLGRNECLLNFMWYQEESCCHPHCWSYTQLVAEIQHQIHTKQHMKAGPWLMIHKKNILHICISVIMIIIIILIIERRYGQAHWPYLLSIIRQSLSHI